MCGRFSLTADIQKVAMRFDAHVFNADWHPRFNIAPGQSVLAVIQEEERKLVSMQFGFIPHWAKERKTGYSMINARAETISQKSSFRQSFKSKRCLIPADGFYEWQEKGKHKLPYRIALKSDALFAFAGIWDSWTNEEGTVIQSMAIITTQGNALTLQLHDRMPVILHEKDEALWLSPNATETKGLESLLVPYPESEMKLFRVSPMVNSWRNDSPDCLKAI
jgi:putative SOS response-associated peptidase YedK